MTFPSIPLVPSLSKRPTEYAVGLAFVATQLANELGAAISATLTGLICVATAFVVSAIVDLVFGGDATEDGATTETYPFPDDPDVA
jgi:hypothetical protein